MTPSIECPSPAHRLDILDNMQASDELNETQVRQIIFDLESAYGAFNDALHKDHWLPPGE